MPTAFGWVYAIWFMIALIVAASGSLTRLTPPWPQVVILSLVAAQIVAYIGSAAVRNAAKRIDLRRLIGFHVTRFVGFYFLWLHAQARLPYEFAVVGGWGDVITAACAVTLLLSAPLRNNRAALLIWNLYGLIDITYVVATAARLALSNPASMRELLVMPLALLPTFVVPVIFSTHLLIFSRLFSKNGVTNGGGTAAP